jgi:hypothetical protein
MFPLHESNKKLRNGWMLTKIGAHNNQSKATFWRIDQKAQPNFVFEQLCVGGQLSFAIPSAESPQGRMPPESRHFIHKWRIVRLRLHTSEAPCPSGYNRPLRLAGHGFFHASP